MLTHSAGGFEPDATLQSFFAELCIQTVRITQAGGSPETASTYSRLRRTSFSILQLLLGNPYASALAELHIEHPLINTLMVSVSDEDSFAQIPILDTLFTALTLQSATNTHADGEHRNSKDTLRSPRQSLSLDRNKNDARRPVHPPPAQLAKCLLAGFSSRSTQPILESWVNFLAACLPILAETVFQILIPFVECLCREVSHAFDDLKSIFGGVPTGEVVIPDARINALLAGLETILAFAHGCLWDNHSQVSGTKPTDQPGFFGNMVSGVFNSEQPQTRSATANNRLSFLLALQDTVRICFDIWSWGLGDTALEAGQMHSKASFTHVFTRTRNKARRLLERLFAVEPLECAEILISVWCQSLDAPTPKTADSVINLLHVLDGSRPKVTVSAVFIAIHSRTNPNTLQPLRKSTLTADLTETDLVTFLSGYARSIDDDAMDEIWKDCMAFLRDVLANPFPHRQIIPKLLEFTAVLGEKMDNTSFGDQRMRRDLSVSSTQVIIHCVAHENLGPLFTASHSHIHDQANGLLPGGRSAR